MVSFWRDAGFEKWFDKDPGFDEACRGRFGGLHMEAAARRHDDWMETAEGAFALILLTDQIPRNIFRNTAHMYATDPLARHYARQALALGYVEQVDNLQRAFFALPLGHCEDITDQDLCVALHMTFGLPSLPHAEQHRDVIRRFGRFPHRNPLLLRETTAEEADFLANGGYAG
jgi:uncharacterized protein (DUF924 family)